MRTSYATIVAIALLAFAAPKAYGQEEGAEAEDASSAAETPSIGVKSGGARGSATFALQPAMAR